MSATANRTDRLLAILLLQNMRGATQAEKALHLSLAGFSNVEIADLLQTSTQVISQHLYTARKQRRSKKK